MGTFFFLQSNKQVPLRGDRYARNEMPRRISPEESRKNCFTLAQDAVLLSSTRANRHGSRHTSAFGFPPEIS
jgi:hypothetical protein